MKVPGALRILLLLLASAAAAFPEGAHGGETHDNVDRWKIANFVILAGLIAYAGARFGKAFFAARTQEIGKGIEEARRMREAAEARAVAMEARLANLNEEIEDLRRHARQEAAHEGERIREETRREIEKIQAHAEREIAAVRKSAQAELQRYAGQLAVRLARQKAAERIGAAEQDALVDSFAARVRAVPAVKSSE